MSLQNRVTPMGEIITTPYRGMVMGNRGGALHDANRQLGTRRWVSRQWICCLTSFRGRQRVPMSPGLYTELFFLDEATAFAAGHRPCFECRRTDAMRFAQLWADSLGLPERARANAMDVVLHAERLTEQGTKRTHAVDIKDLPDGTMILDSRHPEPYLVLGDHLLPWSLAGYGRAILRPVRGTVRALTPPSIMAVLKSGYAPILHESARGPG